MLQNLYVPVSITPLWFPPTRGDTEGRGVLSLPNTYASYLIAVVISCIVQQYIDAGLISARPLSVDCTQILSNASVKNIESIEPMETTMNNS